MPGGRKRIPTPMKALKGTNRSDRTNPAEPKPPAEKPEPTPLLSGRSLWWFNLLAERVVELGVATRVSSEALALAAVRAAEVEALTEDIETYGAHYETESAQGGRMVRAHPAVGQRSEAMRHFHSLLAEFGLTPASLSKVSVTKPDADDEWQRLQAL